LEHVRLVQLVFPFKAKRSVVISATVVTLSAIAHSAIFWVPMPQPQATESVTADTPGPDESATNDEIDVVMLPQSEPPPPPPASTTEAPPSPPSQRAASPAPAPLLPTDVIVEPVAPPPTAADLPPQPSDPPPVEDLPVANGNQTPFFAPPTHDGPLLSYGEQFPHFEGATSGCLGLGECRQVTGVGTYREVADSLIAGLENQGYGVDLRDELEDTGRNVYELTPPGDGAAKQFLLVFQGEELGSAIYVMSPEIMTLDELKSLAAQVADPRQAV
jgi:hypothetical protein